MKKIKYLAIVAFCVFVTFSSLKASISVDDPLAVRYQNGDLYTLSGNGDITIFKQDGEKRELVNLPSSTSITVLDNYLAVSIINGFVNLYDLNATSSLPQIIPATVDDMISFDKMLGVQSAAGYEIWGMNQSRNFLARATMATQQVVKVENVIPENDFPMAITGDANQIYLATEANGTVKVVRYNVNSASYQVIYNTNSYAGVSDIAKDENGNIYLSFYGEGDNNGKILKLDSIAGYTEKLISQNQSMPTAIAYSETLHTLAVANYPADQVSFLLVGAAKKPTLIYPENQSKIEEYKVNFKWDAIEGVSGYDIYLAENEELTENLREITSEISTSRTVVLDTTKQYFWKVRGFNSEDIKGEWSETFSFTSGNMTYAPPTLILPEYQATGVAVRPTFVWSKSNAGIYEIQVSKNPDFSEISYAAIDIDDTTLTITADLLPNTEYYWRVRTYSSRENSSDWSNIFVFTTFNTAPATPVLYHPVNNTVNVPCTPLLEWHPVSMADSYVIELSKDVYFTTGQVYTYEATPKKQMYENYQVEDQLEYFEFYYWRVKAINEYGTGAWSETFAFRVETKPLDTKVFDEIQAVQIYPNPVLDELFIKDNSLQNAENIQIFTENGEIIKELNVNIDTQNEISLSVGDLPSGAYIIKINGKDNIYSGKFIKK